MPKQVIRLLIAFTFFICLFFVVRYFLTPKSFGEYGHYRGDALMDEAAHHLHYAAPIACTDCHSDVDSLKSKGPHKSLNCQTCHGPGYMHTQNPDSVSMFKPASRKFCERCHAKLAGRPSNIIIQIDTTEHNPGNKCIDCHIAHNPLDFK